MLHLTTMTTKHAMDLYQTIRLMYPEAQCELEYQKEHELLIAVMLSAQTTDEAVNRVTPDLFETYPTIEDFANAKQTDLESVLRHLGLFRNKARNIIRTSKMIIKKFDKRIPDSQKELECLPGVGRKTANVFLSEWHHKPRIAVDTHVSRVSKRLGLAGKGDSPKQIEAKLKDVYPEDVWIDLHHKFIFFGRYFCTSRKPKCQACPLLDRCKYPVLNEKSAQN